MNSDKNSVLIGMIEEKYGANLQAFELNRSSGISATKVLASLSSHTHAKAKKNSVLSSIKKIVKFSHRSPVCSPTYLGKDFIRKRPVQSVQSKQNSSYEKEACLEKEEKIRNIQWWDPPQDSFPVEFCQDTSLHGLKFIGQPKRHLSERIFWLLTFVGGLSVAVWLISEMWTKYKLNPVIVSFQPFETNVDQIPFPAVTVCNMNKVMKSKADDYIKHASAGDLEGKMDLYYLDHICSSTKSFAKRFNYTQYGDLLPPGDDSLNTDNLTRVNTFLRKAAQNCTEMIPLCVWQDHPVDCSQLFRPIETEYGKCCTFNMIPLSLLYTKRNDSRETEKEIQQWQKWNIEKDGLLLSNVPELEFPRRQMKAGRTNGLSFLLNANFKEYYCTSSDSIGFRMATHLPLELPKIADFGISLRPKSEIFVDVEPQITMVDPDIFTFSLDQRQCYRQSEFHLGYFKYYSINNCIDECIANETGSTCGCKRYYMPRNSTERLCGPKNFDCAENVKFEKTMKGLRNSCENCMQSCTEVYYEPQTTSTPMKPGVWKIGNVSNSDWDEDDLSIVHVYIGQDSFYAKVRKELYGPTDLFANTGGLMGLCLGFSGLSLIEIVYFLTLRAWWKHSRKQVDVTETKQDDESNKWITKVKPKPPTTHNQSDKTNGRVQTSHSYYQSIFGEIIN